MKSKGKRWTIVLLGVLVLVPGTTWSFEGLGEDGHRGPPAEAIEECKDKNEGTAVEIMTPRGDTIKATCKQINGQRAAVPESGFQGPQGKPPGETQGRE